MPIASSVVSARPLVLTAAVISIVLSIAVIVSAQRPVSFSYTVTLHEKPKFYFGRAPLQIRYTIGVNEDLLPDYRGDLVTLQPFDGWQNVFVYSDAHLKALGIPKRVIALDRRYQKLAEATLIEPTVTEKDGVKMVSGFRIREVHYSEGREVFVAESRIDREGSKTSEDVQKGKKVRDYFFLWPLDRFHQDKVQEIAERNR